MWKKLIKFQEVNDKETLKNGSLKSAQVKLCKALRRHFSCTNQKPGQQWKIMEEEMKLYSRNGQEFQTI